MSSSYEQEVQEWTRRRIYQITPLDTTQKLIRLLELFPGTHSTKLVGRLFVASLDNPPPYAAVSYVWGDQSRAFSIALNEGIPLRIGRNLHHALRDMRHEARRIVLWTDAICIQQHCDVEQNHQVQLMAQIYSRAESVRAWIDHEIDMWAEVFQQLPDVLNAKELRADMSYWLPALNLLQNAYWKRLWIQQELILGREIVINCRNKVLDGRLVSWLLGLPSNISQRARYGEDRRLYDIDASINGEFWEPIFKGINVARAVSPRRHDIRRSREVAPCSTSIDDMGWAGLLTLFLDTHRLETSELKDRVYGMLGLAVDYEEGDIDVDYNLPLASVYAKVPEMMLKKHGHLMFLCHECQVHEGHGLPSWLPAPERKSMIIWSAIGMNPHFDGVSALGASIESSGRCLSVRGMSVSRITRAYTREDFRLAPVSRIVGYFKDYLRRKRGLFRRGDIWEDDEILYICTPWFQEGLYKSMRIPTLDAKQQRATLKRLTEIVEAPAHRALRLVDLLTDLSGLASVQETQAFRGMVFAFQNQILFETADFRLGTVFYLSPVKANDEIWCLYGCPLPIILRPHPNKQDGFTWIGFVRNMAGLMKGEGLAGLSPYAPQGYKHLNREIRQIDLW
ncbi:hypothetical protein E8E12_009079 [Didymella heteroderae]|uniref:Heterokaryon incompatibility domain-containing protein n=1 Tax=Didymella heteroderae TaxID=1769908 RepID=A0A9P4WR81_9PLEO|nr:hypothetical protein E8E12_009079 [Didymella heteroderae]